MEEWERIAKRLPCGRSVRVKCCRRDRSRVISHNEKGYSSYCFRCGEDSRRFKPHGQRTLQERLQHRKELLDYVKDTGPLELPKDFTLDIPSNALAWLLKAGVSQRVAQHYGFGWSPKMNRVVLPVYRDEKLIAVQSRAIHPDQMPKYLNKKKEGVNSPTFRSDDNMCLHDAQSGVRVVVEDILSAVRVGRIMPCTSTLGTHLSMYCIKQFIEEGVNKVHVWYDGDAAGVKGARKAKKYLELMGVQARIINTAEDPKEYNNEEIKDIIGK